MFTEDYFLSEEWKSYMFLQQERPEAFAEDPRLPIITDKEIILEYMNRTGRKIGIVYKSPFSLMVVDLVKEEQSPPFAYERLLPASAQGAVVMIPVLNGSFVLLKQFRHSIREEQYAFPRGFGEPGLSFEENAAKEMEEEIGASVLSLQLLGYVVADSGMSGNRVAVVKCEIDRAERKNGYEGIVDTFLIKPEELQKMIAEGRISDGYTLAAWALLCSKG